MMNKISIFFFLILFASCYRVADQIDLRVVYQLQEKHLKGLPSAFAPLSEEENSSPWGRELFIALAFSDQLDLYRAISTYKRAEILLPHSKHDRLLEIQYGILFCYFLGNKYEEAIETFEKSSLAHVDKTFPCYCDLLLILYECYTEVSNLERKEKIFELISKDYPDQAEKLRLSSAIREGKIEEIKHFADDFNGESYLSCLLDHYNFEKKSISRAQMFNALLPGAGYLYIGQNKSAMTAFFLNALFIAAAYEFFHHRHTAAGIIALSFEAGWYFGGIYGAGEEAKYYNERVYEKEANALLNEKKLFPVLMLGHSF